MKKNLALTLSMIMVMSLAGCSGSSSSTPSESSKSADSTKSTDTTKPDETETKKPEEKPSVSDDDSKKTASPADVEEAIKKALGDGYLSTVSIPEDELFSSIISDIDLTKVDSYIATAALVPAVDMDTLAVLKCKPGYSDEAVKIINDNYARIIDYIDQYPFGVAKVKGARLYKLDDMVIFIIGGAGADSEISAEEEAKLAASEYEKVDNAIKELFGELPDNLAVIPEHDASDDKDENGFFDNTEDYDDSDMPIIGG